MAENLDVLNAAVSLLIRATLLAHEGSLASACPVRFFPPFLTFVLPEPSPSDTPSPFQRPMFRRESDPGRGCRTGLLPGHHRQRRLWLPPLFANRFDRVPSVCVHC